MCTPEPVPRRIRAFVKRRVRRGLLFLGARLSPRRRRKTVATARLLELGAWLDEHGFLRSGLAPAWDRLELYARVAEPLRDRPVAYLEFGVWQGVTMEAWSQLLRHPDSVLHGFDSFEGIPDSWGDLDTGAFSTEGQVPAIDDPRVQFHKGWFEEVLATYVPPQREVLVLNMDADLYGSTKCVLDALSSVIVTGSYVLLNDFAGWDEESRAFCEFVDRSGMQFAVRGHTRDFAQVCFQRVG